MASFIPLALNGFREARRNRVSVIVVVFAAALLAVSNLVSGVTVYSMERVVTDVALGAMSFALVFLAIFLSSGMLAREIERRTIFLMVSKPISRTYFLLARFVGNILTLGAVLAAMALVFFGQLVIVGYPPHLYQLLAVIMLWFEVVVISSVGFAMSANSSQVVSAVVTTSVYFAGHLAPDVYSLSSRSQSEVVRVLGKIAYYALPNLERLNLRPQAAYQLTPSLSQFTSACAYGLAYTAVMLAIATLVFRRRDFR